MHAGALNCLHMGNETSKQIANNIHAPKSKQTCKHTDRQKSKDRGSPFRAFGVPHFSSSSRSGPINSLI